MHIGYGDDSSRMLSYWQPLQLYDTNGAKDSMWWTADEKSQSKNMSKQIMYDVQMIYFYLNRGQLFLRNESSMRRQATTSCYLIRQSKSIRSKLPRNLISQDSQPQSAPNQEISSNQPFFYNCIPR